MSSSGSNHHITSLETYLKVAGALFVLTILTVVFHNMHLGALAAPVAFLIATTKAGFVLLWFMHLKDDSNVNRITFGLAFFFVFLLFIFSAVDVFTRVKEISTL